MLIFWKGTHVRLHGPSSTEGSTGRVLRKKPPRNVPRGLKSSKGPSSEPLFKTLWLRGTKSPKCVRLREIKLYGKTEFLFNIVKKYCTLCLFKNWVSTFTWNRWWKRCKDWMCWYLGETESYQSFPQCSSTTFCCKMHFIANFVLNYLVFWVIATNIFEKWNFHTQFWCIICSTLIWRNFSFKFAVPLKSWRRPKRPQLRRPHPQQPPRNKQRPPKRHRNLCKRLPLALVENDKLCVFGS